MGNTGDECPRVFDEPVKPAMAELATVDSALERIGMGRVQASVLLATGLTWSGDAMELGVMAFLVPVLKDEWDMPQAVADTIASMVFAGMLIGALGWGLLSDSHGRRFVWLITTALTAIGGIASAAVPDGSVGALIAARVVVGIGLSGTNLGFALACEFLPGARRGAALVLFELFFSLGSVFEVCRRWPITQDLRSTARPPYRLTRDAWADSHLHPHIVSATKTRLQHIGFGYPKKGPIADPS